MSTLAKRATPRQAVVMRMVAGAVINAGHAHPTWNISPTMARSIAKRAAGTLTAGWPDVLAAPRVPSERADGVPVDHRSVSRSKVSTADEGGRRTARRRSPLRFLHNAVGAMASAARRAGDTDRERALVDVLRMIAKLA